MVQERVQLRIVRIKAKAAQQGIDRFGEMPQKDADPPERKIPEREIRIEVDCTLRFGQGPLLPVC